MNQDENSKDKEITRLMRSSKNLQARLDSLDEVIELLAAKIVHVNPDNFPPANSHLDPYLARGSNRRYYPYFKWRNKEKVFPIEHKDSEGNVISRGLGHSKHVGAIGTDKYITAVELLMEAQAYYLVQQQIDSLNDIKAKLLKEANNVRAQLATLAPDLVPEAGAAVLGGELGREMRRKKQYEK